MENDIGVLMQPEPKDGDTRWSGVFLAILKNWRLRPYVGTMVEADTKVWKGSNFGLWPFLSATAWVGSLAFVSTQTLQCPKLNCADGFVTIFKFRNQLRDLIVPDTEGVTDDLWLLEDEITNRKQAYECVHMHLLYSVIYLKTD